MSTHDRTLNPLLIALGLRAMLLEYAACLVNAEKENWGYRRFLQRLLEIEIMRRQTPGVSEKQDSLRLFASHLERVVKLQTDGSRPRAG